MTIAEFEELYRATAPELFGYLRRRAVTDPEDLVAEAYAIAWRRRAEVPAPIFRRAWMFGTVRRLASAQRRNRSEEARALDEAERLGRGSELRTDDHVEGVVAAALGRLSAEDRELIRLVEWEHLTPAEVAVAFGIRPGTARVRLHRARRSLALDPELDALVRSRQFAEPPEGLRFG